MKTEKKAVSWLDIVALALLVLPLASILRPGNGLDLITRILFILGVVSLLVGIVFGRLRERGKIQNLPKLLDRHLVLSGLIILLLGTISLLF